MEKIKFIEVTPEQLQKQISTGVKEQLNEFLKHYTPKQANKYLTQQKVTIVFNVNISIIHNMYTSNCLKPLSIDFLCSDIEKGLISMVKYLVHRLVMKFLYYQFFN